MKDFYPQILHHGALQDRAIGLLPAFAIGLTWELLYELEDIIHQQKLLNFV